MIENSITAICKYAIVFTVTLCYKMIYFNNIKHHTHKNKHNYRQSNEIILLADTDQGVTR